MNEVNTEYIKKVKVLVANLKWEYLLLWFYPINISNILSSVFQTNYVALITFLWSNDKS